MQSDFVDKRNRSDDVQSSFAHMKNHIVLQKNILFGSKILRGGMIDESNGVMLSTYKRRNIKILV